ncbi:methionine--tRNA ligase [Litorilinea aerophila]|uniref:Methionine--tRNA ligase n=1 Tax=Litorilinea aerophila TaxID=1204385 RepID=A0A540VE39_9CHLR|nr:methionine--tRNA ligase [Litorilinea aerophila]MCC9077280.1 methionine--tRNA ligase [Litorilinea aerophila]GIV79475.1 MAG: methionine--tRNA ligase [Litorilinea sp.]
MANEARHILVGVAWPYANGEKHIGQIAGAYLPPDIFARYQRMVGNHVLMVSGSDTHGTPVTLKAEQEGTTPAAVIDKYHALFIDGCLKMGLTFDLYTHTDTQNHWNVTHQMFLRHLETGYLYKDVQKQWYDPQARRFLADRYVEGTCPFCGYPDARGDQCDNCGRLYDALELKNARSKITGNTELEVRETEHFFLDMAKMVDPLLAWINQDKEHWRPNVLNFTRGQLELRELRGRPITRDIDWGVTIPLPGYEGKRIYVWYDAVIGYLSAAIEWAKLMGDDESWRRWWDADVNPAARIYNFIGKDNIPFHTIIWPGMLIGYNAGGSNLHLPYDVPANEYLTLGGEQFSTSRGRVIGFNTVLRNFQPDAWRYVLTALAPETSDVEFTWQDFLDRVNNELVANWGNLVNRVLGFAYRRFEGQVPAPGDLDEVDQAFLAEIRAGFDSVGQLYDAVKLKAALTEVRRLSQRVNQYLNEKAPWQAIRTDPTAAATSIYVALQAIDWLKLLWAPILPHSSEQLHTMLGYDRPLFGRQYTETVSDERGSHLVLRYDHTGATGRWEATTLPAGQRLGEPVPLFEKLEEAELAERLA